MGRTKRYIFSKSIFILIYFVFLLLSCKSNISENNYTQSSSGLKYKIVKEGQGKSAIKGQEVLIHETMSYTNDSLLFDSRKLSHPIKVLIGGKQAIQGVDEGLNGMKTGEIKKLIVPSRLSKRSGNANFPHPDSTLIYQIELIEILN